LQEGNAAHKSIVLAMTDPELPGKTVANNRQWWWRFQKIAASVFFHTRELINDGTYISQK